MFKHADLNEKVIIVTGGTRGIGKAMVNLFANAGANVHFFFKNSQADADAIVKQAQENNQKITAYQVDVTNKDLVDQTIQEIFSVTNRIDVLINNSGIVQDDLLMGLSKDAIDNVLTTNINGVFYVTQSVVPFMVSQRAGKIINISSVSAIKGGRGQTNYAASKGAINAFTKSLAVELAKRNITVNAVAPGVIDTDISKNVRDLAGNEVKSKILLKRFGKPEDVANLVAFLASKYADYINGEVIHIDGGFKMA